MCGRYLIEEEAYSDILEILYRSGTLAPVSHNSGGTAPAGAAAGGSAAFADFAPAAQSLPPAFREAMAAVITTGRVSETVPGDIRGLFPDDTVIVTNGEVFPTNIAPVLTIADDNSPFQRGTALLKWGFPHRKDSSVIINARSETALEKKMFRDSLLNRRCVIPSNGFFEWGISRGFDNIQIGMFGSGDNMLGRSGTKRGKKTKFLIRHPDERKLYMAGFWNTFGNNNNIGGGGSGVNGGSGINGGSGVNGGSGAGSRYNAFVILTTGASRSVSPIHNRMPLILSPDEVDDWLGSIEFAEYALRRPGPELTAETAA